MYLWAETGWDRTIGEQMIRPVRWLCDSSAIRPHSIAYLTSTVAFGLFLVSDLHLAVLAKESPGYLRLLFALQVPGLVIMPWTTAVETAVACVAQTLTWYLMVCSHEPGKSVRQRAKNRLPSVRLGPSFQPGMAPS